MNLETQADNFRHANVFDENLQRISNAEFKAVGFRTMTQVIDFEEKV